MRIAIAGAGVAGTYLSRLLEAEGFGGVDLYDVKKNTGCGSRPCAWGFAPSSEYRRLVSRFLDPEAYLKVHSRWIEIDGAGMGADLLTVDKPALIRALQGDAKVDLGPLDPSKYDRVVDATGVNRSYLGPTEGVDLIADLHQYRVRSDRDLGLWIRSSSIGYAWCFPLGDGEFHIGYGYLPSNVAGDWSAVERVVGASEVRCRCSSQLRISSPSHSRPFSKYNIVGVGESIGTVAPLGGDGNIYSMQCAEMLVEHWDDPDGYAEAVLARFDWMRKERLAIERLMGGKLPTPGDVRTFVQHSRRAGFAMGPIHAVRYLSRALTGGGGAEGA